MSLRFIFGRDEGKKSDFYISETAGYKNSALIVVPEQMSYVTEKKMTAKMGVHGLGGAEISSFKKLGLQILSKHEGACLRRIDACGKCLLLVKIINDNIDKLTILKVLANDGGGALKTAQLFTEFKRYNISADDLVKCAEKVEGNLSYKLSDMALLYDEYGKAIKGRYVDDDDDIMRLSYYISDYVKDKEVYFDGFDSFTPTEILCVENALKTAKRVSVTVNANKEDLSKTQFRPVAQTVKKLRAFAEKVDVAFDEDVCLEEDIEKPEALFFLENELFNYGGKVYDKETDSINMLSASDAVNEVRMAANEIVRLCRDEKYMYRDIALVCGNMEKYEKHIKNIFPLYGIRFFADRRINVLEHPLSVFILSALDIIIKGYSRETVFKWLKTGFVRFRANDTDVLENYVLATGIRTNGWTDEKKWETASSIYKGKRDADEELLRECEIADKTRRKIVTLTEHLHTQIRDNKSVEGKCKAVYDFLEKMKVRRRILAMAKLWAKEGELAKAEEYKSVYNRIVEALDSMVDAFGEDTISIKKFRDILKTGLSAFDTAIVPASLDGVSVGEAGRVKGYDVKALFVIGVNDGVFPGGFSDSGVLCESDRKNMIEHGLEIAPDMQSQCLDRQYLVYKTLTMSKLKLYVSYALSDIDGKGMQPSYVFSRIGELFPKVKVNEDFSKNENINILNAPSAVFEVYASHYSDYKKNNAVYDWFKQSPEFASRLEVLERADNYKNTAVRLSPELSNKIWGDNIHMSVSRLEEFARCPFSYFARYTLKAKERNIMKMRALDAGNFLHDFIDEFSRNMETDGKSYRTIDDEYIEKATQNIMNNIKSGINIYAVNNSKRYIYIFSRLTDIAKKSVKNISEHIKRGEFEPVGFEMSFSENGDFKPLTLPLPNGSRVTLTGRIDRVDALNSDKGKFIRIIDYKSGAKEFELDDVFYGLNLQMGVYMTAICDGEEQGQTRPAGMLYYRLSDTVTSVDRIDDNDKIEKAKRKNTKLSGIILSDAEIVDKMDKGLSGISDFLPIKVNGDGCVSGNGGVTAEQFNVLSRHIKRRVKELSQAMSNGVTDISPFNKKGNKPCDYCPYISICGFDAKTPGCSYRFMGISDNEDLWRKIRGDENED